MLTSAAGSASVQGKLWGARARDWAEVQEPLTRPLYEAALDRLRLEPAARVCDVGCGSGVFCELAARRGAEVSGFDASEALIAIARSRLPEADFRVAEMEQLPDADASFDAVTGFNSFQYAADPVHALREAARVAKPTGRVVVATWGRAEECEAAGYLAALASLLPPPPPGAPGPFALSEPGALEALASEAGLRPQDAAEVECPFGYPDLETALRGLLSAGPAAKAIATAGEARVRDVVAEAIAPYRSADSGYRLENTFRYLLAAANEGDHTDRGGG
jgi:SAM-dependent methyltransferase